MACNPESYSRVRENIPEGTTELTQVLARRFLGSKVGDHVPTVRKLATEYRMSLGSVSAVLGKLEQSGAVTLERHGRLGTFLSTRSLGDLWMAAAGEPLIVSLPLPSTPRFEGLATGIKTLLTQAGIEVFLIFIRGSRRRLQALRQGRCHVAVMSSFAADELCGREDTSVLELPPKSFVTEHRVFIRHSASSRHTQLRVAVDRDSVDQQRLAELEFQDSQVEFVSANYIQLARVLEKGLADAAVWSLDEMGERRLPSIEGLSLSEGVRRQVGDSDTRANLIARCGDSSAHAAITEGIDVEALMQIEQAVLDGQMVPEY